MSGATEALRRTQQADQDGVFVCVSRQAVVEALAEYEELLEALTECEREIRIALTHMTGLVEQPDLRTAMESAQRLARAAIAKAEGIP